ncbi:MAG: YebC/PmpR family DNA-binding transcriptional regulator [Pseudomonadota bacterium]
MAGHSKWANIQHRKGRQDKIRGKIFSRCAKEIMVAAKQGGGDPDGNPRLRLAIEKARAANMTKDKIDNAIKKATGEAEALNIEEVRYEGYGPGGIAVMVDCVTDNKNRTVAEVRHAFSKSGGNLGTDGSVSYLFNKRGVIELTADSDEEQVMSVALEYGADDIITEEDHTMIVYTNPDSFETVKGALAQANLTITSATITMIATTRTVLDKAMSEKLLKLLDLLEDLDDVQEVYSNADIADECLSD